MGQDGCVVIETTWHNITAYESEKCRDLSQITKGSKLHILGRIRNQRYATSDGSAAYSTEILATEVSQLPDDVRLLYQE